MGFLRATGIEKNETEDFVNTWRIVNDEVRRVKAKRFCKRVPDFGTKGGTWR